MDTEKLRTAAERYIKQKVRLAIAAHSSMEGMRETMIPYDEEVSRKWFEELGRFDYKNPLVFDQISIVVNRAFEEAVRHVRENAGDTPITHRGLADFHQTFDVNEMLLRGES